MESEKQSFNGNGIAISYPIGFQNVRHYLSTLNLNLNMLKRMPSIPERAKLIAEYEAEIKQVEKALA